MNAHTDKPLTAVVRPLLLVLVLGFAMASCDGHVTNHQSLTASHIEATL